ncbi:MAG: helix-turn-helix domain-containing protein, partial [Corynebacterium casei]|nr:helix-turn-helix domain-containing protein [Corynebacterium casei]
MTSPSSDFVQSFARGLMVIRSFDASAPSQTLSQVAASTGLSRAAARRFLHTLVEEGYAVNNDGQFTLTPRVLELGYSYLSALTLPALAQPRLEGLSAQVGESCSMSVLDGTD